MIFCSRDANTRGFNKEWADCLDGVCDAICGGLRSAWAAAAFGRVLALGANDGLRGLPVKQMRANLETMIRAAQQAGPVTPGVIGGCNIAEGLDCHYLPFATDDSPVAVAVM